MYKKKLGDLLIENGCITGEQLKDALVCQKETGKKLGSILIEKEYITEEQMFEILEFQVGVPHIEIKKYGFDLKAARMIPKELSKKYGIVPVRIDRGRLILAMNDPLNVMAIDDTKFISKMDVIPVLASINDINEAIEKAYEDQKARKATEELISEVGNNPGSTEVDEGESVTNAPAVVLVNTIITQAVKMRASDIHVEPFEKNTLIRYRIDGELKEIQKIPASTHSSISTRIKILSNLNIAEKRVPQDGRINMKVDNNSVDLRVSVYPTIYGEKIVIRILNRNTNVISIDTIGFSEKEKEEILNMIKRPYGIVLASGPTGSGKSTTLYALLRELNDNTRNIITIEDPVEYTIDGINQSNVNTKAGFNFATALRSMLRQDPDVIMVGEMRDEETAEIAVKAAITGHIVLSTIHTNDAPSSITRLIDMNVQSYMVTTSVIGVIAQRLVRTICPDCKESYVAGLSEKRVLNAPEDEELILYRGKGCSRCSNSGYRGRTAIREILTLDRELCDLIEKRASADELKDYAVAKGMRTLKKSCIDYIYKGITTVDELIRVVFTRD